MTLEPLIVLKATVFLNATTSLKITTLRDYAQPLSTYIVQDLFALANLLYIALARYYKTRSVRIIIIIILGITG